MKLLGFNETCKNTKKKTFFFCRKGYPTTGFQVDAVDKVVLNLQDDVSSWNPGDRIVVASTDYSMYQAEEFTLLPCPNCDRKQVRIRGEVALVVALIVYSVSGLNLAVNFHEAKLTVSMSLRQEKGEDCLPETHK